MFKIAIVLLLMCMVVPYVVFQCGEKKKARFKRILFGNIASFFTVLLFSTVFVFSSTAMATAMTSSTEASSGNGFAIGMAFLGAALAMGLGSVGAGIATGNAASAALGALSENEGIMGKALIFVALAEGISIFGLAIAFMILNYVPQLIG